MASDITNGKGGSGINVTDSAQDFRIVPTRGTDGHQKFAMYAKVFNTGSSKLYAIVNASTDDALSSTAIPIPSDKDFTFFGQPIKNIILFCASGETTTADYGAY